MKLPWWLALRLPSLNLDFITALSLARARRNPWYLSQTSSTATQGQLGEYRSRSHALLPTFVAHVICPNEPPHLRAARRLHWRHLGFTILFWEVL